MSASRAGSMGGGDIAAVDEQFLAQGVLPRFGDYELQEEIARGGMGVVYRARQRSLNRVVAIKMILAGQLATPESVRRFRLEAESAARLHHPGIVPIYEIGEFETQHYFSMELVEGASLAECIEDFRLRPGTAPTERRQQEQIIAELLIGVAKALDFAHRRGVLHRDLKPSNILIDENGQPRLTDFGLAKLTGNEASGLTLSTAVLGTPGYLAPEQAAGKTDEITTAADIYGLGATLYELLTGRPPFAGKSAVQTMLMAIDRTPDEPRKVNPEVDRDLQTIAMRCLEKSPEKRYRSAVAVAEELERFLRREPILARPVGRLGHFWRWCQRNPKVAVLSLAFLLALAAGAVAVTWQWRRAEQANTDLRRSISHLEWDSIDDLVSRKDDAAALARLAALLRADPNNQNAATLAMSILEHRKFPVPAAPPIRHPGGAELTSARLSPDGRRIVTTSFDGTARLWDPKTSTEATPPLNHGGTVNWADFGPDGKSLATCAADGTVHLWDSATGKPRWDRPCKLEGAVLHVDYARDGAHILARTAKSLVVLDPADGHIAVGPINCEGRLVAARFIAGGAQVVSAQNAGSNSCIRAWDVADGREHVRMSTPPMRYADVSEDGLRVAVIEASTRKPWSSDFREGAPHQPLLDCEGDADQVHFGPDGNRLAVVGHNHWARVWDCRTGQPLTFQVSHYYLVNGAAFIDSGNKLLSWGDDARAVIWDIAADDVFSAPMQHSHRVIHAEAGAMDGGEVLLAALSHLKSRSADTRTGAAQLWRVQSGQNPQDRSFGLDPHEGHDGALISPDGRLAAIGCTSDDISIYDIRSGAEVCPSFRVNGGAWGMAFAADSKRLFVTTPYGDVSVWSIPEGKQIGRTISLKTMIQPAERSPDGRLFATGSVDGFVRLWDGSGGPAIHAMRHGAEINSLAFSPDGRWVASAGEDRVVKIWDTSTGALARELTGHQNEVMTVFFSPDGKRIVTGSLDFTARIWDAATCKELFVLPHQGEVIDIAISPDSSAVATASRDRTAVIWDMATGSPRTRLMRHEQAVRNLCFSPDGKRLLTVDFHGLRLWDVETGHPITVHLRQTLRGGTGFQTSGNRAGFTPDGNAALLAMDSIDSRLWNFPHPTTASPAWFPEFLEAVAGQRFNAGNERSQAVGPEAFLDLRRRLQESSARDEYTAWTRRWLSGDAGATAKEPRTK